mmetsp:Transcript_36492/g.56066  ORF Transcript_36492/g.56066 Transcript_36492/m.56066 type:complete len:249 (+) Transcript_36492:87-833(+)
MSSISSFFEGVTNEVIDASERIGALVDEAITIVSSGGGGGSSSGQNSGTEKPPVTSSLDFDDEFDLDGMESPLRGIADNVMQNIFEGHVGPRGPMEQIQAFKSAIRWGEPLILCILGFHCVMILSCIYAARSTALAPRISVMLVIGVIVRSAEWLNSYGSLNWQRFATQNYFDRSGIFIGIMLCAPLLFYSFVMLIWFLREASSLLKEVKQRERRAKKASKGKKETGGNSTSKEKKEKAGDNKVVKKD